MGYSFSDLVDIEKLQELFDSIYEATGIIAGVADIDGKVLTKTGWTNLCKKFHRGNPKISHRCIESTDKSSELMSKALEGDRDFIYYECKNGIIHAITPIYIQGRIMALVYKSQFLLSSPDLEYFRSQAMALGIPPEEYIEAVKELPVYTKEEMDRFMKFASNIAELFGEMGFSQLELFKEQKKSKSRYKELIAKHKELIGAYKEMENMREELYSRRNKIQDQEGELKVSEDRIQYLAYYDRATGLPNRHNVIEHISHWLGVAEREDIKGALFFLDIDNFKVINDTFGHEFGDKVLKRLGTELERICGTDSIVGRFGGDEFILAKFGIKDKEAVRDTIDSILDIFNSPWVIDNYEIYPTASLGVTIFPDDGNETETLLKNADIAMYEAKEHGNNSYVFFEPSMNDRVVERMGLDRDIRNALDREEFSLVYQPQINSKTGRIEAVEALIRWNHPQRGYIPPDQFIPFAEETGLIIPIGEWVLRTACRQNGRWQDKGYNPVRMSVNISPIQLRRRGFISLVEEILGEVELDPSYLELEITESSLMESMEENIGILRRLNQMGVRIALDDFGIGYSSLNYLQRLPINNVKIDKSFVKDITKNVEKRYIAEVIITLAHKMNLTVTAEGVETEEQLRMLVNKRCDLIQGFLFSEPLPAAEAEKLIMQGRLSFSGIF